ncbi:putative sodium-coupled neutral amino acid transporter 10 [Musca vetustissima]|uniref:putative sodium-coupled neutral amino acid transporter 10 n=1 Tax=Musca vetustissima TaxID=27455 RepID=UPI002AB6CB51|nr:putative sodium-coupled neutral amino acid transporter 10 [Musca vetustissima]
MLANSGYVMTLANSIIGVGILAMPFCFQKCGIILSIVLLVASNWVTRICCHYLIKTSLLTRRKSIELLGFHAFGTSGKLLVELCIIGYLLGTCITYFVVVGDLGPQIVKKMLSLEHDYHHLRTLLMCGVTLVCIIPLGMLKNVSSLSTVCTASIGFYVCLVIKIILESKTHIKANDWTGEVVYWQPSGVLQCLPIFSMALSCQMQLFEVFTTINNQSLEKLNGIVRNATWICTFVYIAVGFFGYVAFCTQKFSGNILINLSPSFGSDVIKIGFVLSVAFSFPLVIFPCRASLYSLLYRKGQMDASAYIPETRFKAITLFIVIFSLGVALTIPSVELIIGLVGSTIGVAICVMFPAACFRSIIRKNSMERSLAQLIIIGGFCLMILGTYANLSAIDEKSSGPHMEVAKIDEILLKPTELPAPHNLLDEKIKNIEKAMEEKYAAKVEEENKNQGLKQSLENPIKANNNSQITAKIEKPSPPPLPVDEIHLPHVDEDIKEKKVEEVKTDLGLEKNEENVQPPAAPKEEEINIQAKESKSDIKIVENKEVGDKKSENSKTTAALPQQTIDHDAIRKDEEIAKEEMKIENKQENEELKKTKEELEKTKDLLEKKVEELKEELVKQNQETQNLVVEKLGEVVEKFEEIERKVQNQKVDDRQDKPALNDQAVKGEEKVKEEKQDLNKVNNTANAVVTPSKGSLISILTDNRNLSNDLHAQPESAVYEPLSYKTGELIEHARNSSSNLEKRLPLPLALLINASQAKINESISNNKIPKETLNVTNSNNANRTQETDKINIDSIRREILQLHETAENSNSPTNDNTQQHQPLDNKNNAHRMKRSNLMSEDNCLPEPNIENLLAGSSSLGNAAGDLEMKIGRDLKSIDSED